MKRLRFLVPLLVVVVACASAANQYAAATQDQDARSKAYVKAGNAIQSMRGVGAVSDAQWAEFMADTKAVRDADNDVYADLQAWRDSGKKPAGYDGHAKTLADAQGKVLALAQAVGVQP